MGSWPDRKNDLCRGCGHARWFHSTYTSRPPFTGTYHEQLDRTPFPAKVRDCLHEVGCRCPDFSGTEIDSLLDGIIGVT